MKQLKDTAYYPKIYEAVVSYGAFGMSKQTFYSVASGIASRFNELEADKNLSPFPIIDVENLHRYFNPMQLRFMRKLDRLNPQGYPQLQNANIATGNILTKYTVLADQKVDGISLGERVIKSDIFILFAEHLSNHHQNEIFYLTHGYRSEGYQLLFRTWLIGTFKNLYKNLCNCAPSRNSTHSLHAHAIDIGTVGSITGKTHFKETSTYDLFHNSADFEQEYTYEPWHFRPHINAVVRVMNQGEYVYVEGKTIKTNHFMLAKVNNIYKQHQDRKI